MLRPDDIVIDRRWLDRARSMSEPLLTSVQPGSQFRYEYVVGTPTELVGRARELLPAPTTDPVIRIVARNDPPECRCAACGQTATRMCTRCYQQMDAPWWYCESCASRHECGELYGGWFLPLVNSPHAKAPYGWMMITSDARHLGREGTVSFTILCLLTVANPSV